MDSPKKAELSKAVLNVTTYKQHPENEFIGIPQATSIDITDLLDKNGVDHVAQVNGVSFFEDDSDIMFTRFVIDEAELDTLSHDIYDIIDAAIVNEKQSKAIKHLITSRFDTFRFKHWGQIRNGDIL